MANKKLNQLVTKPSIASGDLFPIADATTGQLYKTTISDLGTAIGSGVSSVNGLVGAVVLDTDDIQELASPVNKWFTDTRARAALSASSPLTYNSGTGVFGIPQANGSTNGFLSSADWTTFNNKLSTATAASTYVPYTGATANVDLGLNYSLTAASIIKSGGTSSQFLKADGSIDTNTYLTTGSAASTYLPLTGGTLTGDLTLSSTNPRLYFTDTDNNPDYFISNTDGTFTVYDVTNSTSRLTITNLNTTLNTNLRIEGDVLIKQDGVFGGVAGYTAIGSDSAGIYLKSGTATSHAYLVLSGLTSYRNFTLPDATGTIALTSNLSSYLPLSGGTLTGALSGTIATFNSGASPSVFNTATGQGIAIENSGASNKRYRLNVDGTSFLITEAGVGTPLTIAAGGAATFSSSIQTTNIGINFAPQTDRLFVYNGAGTNTLITAQQDGTGDLIRLNGNGGANRFIVQQAGNVGIGTTSPGAPLEIRAGSGANYRVRANGTNVLLLQNYNDTDAYQDMQFAASTLIFNTGTAGGSSSTERARITSGGTLCVGRTTSPSSAYTAAFQEAIAMYINTNGNNMINWFNASGTYVSSIVINSSTVMYNTVSDYRLKEDLKSFKGLDLISKINVYDYKWKSDGTRMYGVVAHELQEVLPDAVSGLKDAVNPDGSIKNQGVDYSKIVPVMVQAIKDLKAELDTLKNK